MFIKINSESITIEHNSLDVNDFIKHLCNLQSELDFKIFKTNSSFVIIFVDFLVELPFQVIDKLIYDRNMTLVKKLLPWNFCYDLKNNLAVFRSVYYLSGYRFYEHLIISLYSNNNIGEVYYKGDKFFCELIDGKAFTFEIKREDLEELALTRRMCIKCKKVC